MRTVEENKLNSETRGDSQRSVERLIESLVRTLENKSTNCLSSGLVGRPRLLPW